MPIRYSSVVGGSGGGTGFNLDVGASGNTTFTFSEPQPAGGYSITSQLTDSTIELYAIAEDGSLAGYTNTKALTASQDFTKMVVYGGTNNDLITFEYKPTTLPTGNGDQDSGAAPFITSVSDADLANIDDTTIITGGNFATDVTVTFTGTDNVVRSPKSVVRTNSTQLILTRPDDFLEDNSPYTLEVSNPGIPQSAYRTYTSSVTAGGGPVWVTASGALPEVTPNFSTLLEATDPDGGTISYSIVSGSLQSGLSLNSSTGEISGTPTEFGVASFTVSATDSGGNVANRSFSLDALLATGGNISEDSGYRMHTFTSNGTFIANGNIQAEYLIVAGGASGGAHNGAGGGAGGLIQSSMEITPASYSIEIGAGGAAVSNRYGNEGTPTSALGISATGGGRGGSVSGQPNGPATSGGSGGGGGAGFQGAPGIEGQGNAGGDGGTQVVGVDGSYRGGGGGGAATAGGNGFNNQGWGDGGNGVQVFGSYFAGGGGGSIYQYGRAGNGGLGGGGGGSHRSAGDRGGIDEGPGLGGVGYNNGQPGVKSSTGAGGNAGTNTGGGGGGANGSGGNSGSGGSGIVIIRYQI